MGVFPSATSSLTDCSTMHIRYSPLLWTSVSRE